MSAPAFLSSHASIVIIVVIILVSLGYILYLFGMKGVYNNFSMSIPGFGSGAQQEMQAPRAGPNYSQNLNSVNRNQSLNLGRIV